MKLSKTGGFRYENRREHITSESPIVLESDDGQTLTLPLTEDNRRLAECLVNAARSDQKFSWRDVTYYAARGLSSWPRREWIAESSDAELLTELALRLGLRDCVNADADTATMARAIADRLAAG